MGYDGRNTKSDDSGSSSYNCNNSYDGSSNVNNSSKNNNANGGNSVSNANNDGGSSNANNASSNKNGLAAYLARLLVERALGLLIFLIGSGWVLGARGALWFVVYFAAIASVIWLYRAAPDTMAARLAIAESKDATPAWDKVLLAVFWLLGYFVVYWVAGKTCDPHAPVDAIAIGGVVIYLLSTALTAWALSENRYAEAVSRMQGERGQRVCSTGPYAYVRHPMYSAIVMWCVAVTMVFPSVWVAAVAVAVAVVIAVRTALEDAMLADGLEGYSEYRRNVRWRLIPFIW